MRRIVLYILLLFLWMSVQSCTKVFHSVYQTEPVFVDGSLSEWGYAIADENRDKSGKVKFAFSNDNENLYIVLRFFDKTTQAKVCLGGLEVRIDTVAKQENSALIYFPLEIDSLLKDDKPKWDFYHGERRGIDSLPQWARRYNVNMKIKSAIDTALSVYSTKDTESLVRLAFDWDEDDALIFEYAVPFKIIYSDKDKFTDKKLYLSFLINGVPKQFYPEQKIKPQPTPQKGIGNKNAKARRGRETLFTLPEGDPYLIYSSSIDFKLILKTADF